MRLIRDSAQDRLERLLPDDASDRASLLASSTGRPPPPRRIINSGLVSRRCWFSTRRVSDEVNGRLPSTPSGRTTQLEPDFSGFPHFSTLHDITIDGESTSLYPPESGTHPHAEQAERLGRWVT